MYLGHLAAGLALKARVREAPLSWLLVATVASDLLCGVLLITGAEHVVMEGRCVKFASGLAELPYSHSLVGTLALAAVGFAVGARVHSRRVGGALGLAVISHYVLDALSHRADMPVIGFGVRPDRLLGTGLALYPSAHYLVELAWCVLGWAILDRSDRRLLWVMLGLMLLYTNTLFAFWCLPPPSNTVLGASMLVLFAATPAVLLWASRSR